MASKLHKARGQFVTKSQIFISEESKIRNEGAGQKI